MKVLIVDDHILVRDGLRSLLEARGIEVVGEATNGEEAVELARELKPDIVLMDLMMPKMDGIEATKLISAELPEIKVVVLTASEEEEDLFEAIRSGASGYIIKNIDPDRFFELLEAAYQGEPALPPNLARKVLQEFAQPKIERKKRPDAELTDREREILELLVQGITSNKEIAERLFLSESTVKYHLHNILNKLHLQNRAQVVAYALQHGLIPKDKRQD
ncbi:two component transcriptional regulator, LuxR family [Thermobaculum terrenum ATCC BAA-798]|uniref:Two component transcriptional regulator, LuxR family n=1 Tax=Thermobaculum terrenum (strain ATCC BAA-798 / CCMEE 7001 / YNP1) TaxID=525904 RepID=D1CB60_THET1|nr:response regulator transcription factor [Thermobaculum terrenum]ACZ42025.1 two component transcriptional regulator, LuxR family [Thermobaculum terrenum ATCC BAA-798]